jgi:CelD/BcsL family acetyltransferase involved in cellulose biosynthesis
MTTASGAPLEPDSARGRTALEHRTRPAGRGVLRAAWTSITHLSAADRARWHLLALQRPESAPLVDATWMRAWTTAFAPSQPGLLCAWEGEDLVGLAAVQSLKEVWGGRRLPVLQSLTNDESFRFDFLLWEGRVDIGQELWRVLCEAKQWDVIRLMHVPEGSPTITAGLAVARDLGWRILLEPTFHTPWRRCSPDAPWDHDLKRKFKANLRNRERRLAALGDVSFEVVTDEGRMRQALDVFYALEGSGWKGEHGTAVAQRQQVKCFYDDLVGNATADVRIPILTVRGRPIAAQILRVCGRTMFMLKTAYDQEYAEYAPGQLVTAQVIQYGLTHGIDALDFLADNASWKADWAPLFRPHYQLLLFAPSLAGGYAYWTRYGLREQAKRLPGAVPLARWLRAQRP